MIINYQMFTSYHSHRSPSAYTSLGTQLPCTSSEIIQIKRNKGRQAGMSAAFFLTTTNFFVYLLKFLYFIKRCIQSCSVYRRLGCSDGFCFLYHVIVEPTVRFVE